MADSRANGLALWLALVFPSSFVVDKFLGWECTVVYAIIVGFVVARKPQLIGQLSDRNLVRAALLTWSIIVVAFLVVYPIVNTQAPGTGSDDDDALNLGAMALLSWRSPYHAGRSQLLSHLGLAVVELMAVLAVSLSFTQRNAAALFRNCALVQGAKVVHFLHRDAGIRDADVRRLLPHFHQAVDVGVRQRPQQHRVNHAEDCGLAPMPRASVSSTTAVYDGYLRRLRSANRTSWLSMGAHSP